MTILPLPFQFGYFFFLFSCMIDVAKTSDSMLKRSGKSGHPCLVPYFSRKVFGTSLLMIMLAVGKHLFVEIYFLYAHFGKNFYHEWMSNFIKCFFFLRLYGWLCGLVFPFVDAVYHINWFEYVELSLWHWNESYLIMVYDLLYVLLDLVC